MTLRTLLFLLCSIALTVGCPTRGGDNPEDDDDDDNGPDPITVDPREQCERYLACAAVATPEAFGGIVASYGEEGACWGNGVDDQCGLACETAHYTLWREAPFSLDCRIPWPEAVLPELEPEGFSIGQRLPDFTGVDQFGDTVSLGQWYGRWTAYLFSPTIQGFFSNTLTDFYAEVETARGSVPLLEGVVVLGPEVSAETTLSVAEAIGGPVHPMIGVSTAQFTSGTTGAGPDKLYLVSPDWYTWEKAAVSIGNADEIASWITATVNAHDAAGGEPPAVLVDCGEEPLREVDEVEPNDEDEERQDLLGTGIAYGPIVVAGTVSTTGNDGVSLTGDLDKYHADAECLQGTRVELAWSGGDAQTGAMVRLWNPNTSSAIDVATGSGASGSVFVDVGSSSVTSLWVIVAGTEGGPFDYTLTFTP